MAMSAKYVHDPSECCVMLMVIMLIMIAGSRSLNVALVRLDFLEQTGGTAARSAEESTRLI